MFDPDPSPDPNPISPGYPTPPVQPPTPPDPAPEPPTPPPPLTVAPVTIPTCGGSYVNNFNQPYGDEPVDPVIINGPSYTGPTKDSNGDPLANAGPGDPAQGGWNIGGSTYNGTTTSGSFLNPGGGSGEEWTGFNLNLPPNTIMTSPIPAQFTTVGDNGWTYIYTGILVQNADGSWSFYITSIVAIDPACPVPVIPQPTLAELNYFEKVLADVSTD